MAIKERAIRFRCTQEEYETLDGEREKCGMNMSNFIRDKLFREGNRIILNPELIAAMREVIYEINKIGVNINQVAASCNSKGFTANRDLQELRKALALVELRESQIIEIIQGELNHGHNETAPDQGDKWG